MTDEIYLATEAGLATCQRKHDGWQVVDRSLTDQHLTSIIAREGVILAGTTGGIQRSDDHGQHWRAVNNGLTSPHIRWLAYHSDISDLEFAGTEPAGIFVSRDGGEHWIARPEVAALRDKHHWMLPYSPEAGCIRGFAFHGERAYAAAEVGGVLRSDDGGESWALAAGSDGNTDLGGPPEPFVSPDVHNIVVHPSDPDLVFAVSFAGLYRSQDGGATWKNLYRCYCRDLWLDPLDPQHIVFGPAKNVEAGGRIEVTRDGGQSWHLASDGLKVPWPNSLPERISQIDDELFAVLADGRLLVAPLATLKWKFVLEDTRNITAIASMRA